MLRRSRAPSGDRQARRDQARAPFRRRRAAAGAGRRGWRGASSTPTATSRRSPRRWSRRRRPGTPSAGKLKRPGEWIVGDAARDRGDAAISRRILAGPGAARRAAVAAAGAEGLFRRQCGLDRRAGAAARHRQHVRAARRRRGSIPTRVARQARSGRSPRRRRARRSPAPRAGRRRWRCC